MKKKKMKKKKNFENSWMALWAPLKWKDQKYYKTLYLFGFHYCECHLESAQYHYYWYFQE